MPHNPAAGDIPLIYLACPYTHPDPTVREFRFMEATRAAARLVAEGMVVYSPITMTHPIDVELAGRHATLGSDFWVRFDEAFMERCNKMIILKLDGWSESSGILRERRYFEREGKPVSFIDP